MAADDVRDDDTEARRVAEEHYGEPVTKLTRGRLTLWAPTSLVESVRAARAEAADGGGQA